jgi:hypothetical protein
MKELKFQGREAQRYVILSGSEGSHSPDRGSFAALRMTRLAFTFTLVE